MHWTRGKNLRIAEEPLLRRVIHGHNLPSSRVCRLLCSLNVAFIATRIMVQTGPRMSPQVEMPTSERTTTAGMRSNQFVVEPLFSSRAVCCCWGYESGRSNGSFKFSRRLLCSWKHSRVYAGYAYEKHLRETENLWESALLVDIFGEHHILIPAKHSDIPAENVGSYKFSVSRRWIL